MLNALLRWETLSYFIFCLFIGLVYDQRMLLDAFFIDKSLSPLYLKLFLAYIVYLPLLFCTDVFERYISRIHEREADHHSFQLMTR